MKEKALAVFSSAIGFAVALLWYLGKIDEPFAALIGSIVFLSLALIQFFSKKENAPIPKNEEQEINAIEIKLNTSEIINKINLELLTGGYKIVNTSFWNNSNTIFLRWLAFIPINLAYILTVLLYGWILLWTILYIGDDIEQWFRGTDYFIVVRNFLKSTEAYLDWKWIFLFITIFFLSLVFVFWRRTSKLIGILTFLALQICPDNKFSVQVMNVLSKVIFYALTILIFTFSIYDIFFLEQEKELNLFVKIIAPFISTFFFMAPIWVSFEKIKSVLDLRKESDTIDYRLLFNKFRDIDDEFDSVFDDMPFYPKYKIKTDK